jgi:hypothetical protein
MWKMGQTKHMNARISIQLDIAQIVSGRNLAARSLHIKGSPLCFSCHG